ncbi:MAG: hypothetical protein HZA10_02010 [Nitrospirae bacterium]|nr:hypothetical protein [Nitrospirota bacterium]
MGKKVLEVKSGDAQMVEGEFINVNQCSVKSVEGGHVELQQVGAFTIDGEKIDVTQGAAFILRGNELNINQSVSGMTIAENASLNFSLTPLAVAKEKISIDKSAVGVMISKEIKAGSASSLIMVANTVKGNVNTLLDWRSALAFGAVVGGVLGLVNLLRNK